MDAPLCCSRRQMVNRQSICIVLECILVSICILMQCNDIRWYPGSKPRGINEVDCMESLMIADELKINIFKEMTHFLMIYLNLGFIVRWHQCSRF